MNKTIVILLASFIINIAFAQNEHYNNAIQQFQINYNASKYEDIFNSFSSEMKQALPRDKTKQLVETLQNQVGKIDKIEFVGFQQGTYATYKTNFDKGILAINISIDSQHLINGLYIQPYNEPKPNSNKTINALNSYPNQFAEIIFTNSKNFPNNTQLSIAVIQNGKTKYYGIIKKDDTIQPIINQNKVFEIGSITKVFTATVLASLVIDKKIQLNNNINAYYPFPFKDSIRISFQQLANHTSGLPKLPEGFAPKDENNPYKDYDEKALEKYLKNSLNPKSKPSAAYLYSNLGSGILGHTLGLSQKTGFQKLLQKKIFDKYQMKSSYTSSQKLGNRLVKGLNEKGEIVANWDFDVLFGAGGILSTTEDLAKFANAQFNLKNAELSLTRKPSFDVHDHMKIGLGWHILKTKSGFNWIWHNGGTGGYSSSMVLDVQKKNGIIILSNVSAFNPNMENIDKLCFELMRIIDAK